jgi:hypothetical protein
MKERRPWNRNRSEIWSIFLNYFALISSVNLGSRLNNSDNFHVTSKASTVEGGRLILCDRIWRFQWAKAGSVAPPRFSIRWRFRSSNRISVASTSTTLGVIRVSPPVDGAPRLGNKEIIDLFQAAIKFLSQHKDEKKSTISECSSNHRSNVTIRTSQSDYRTAVIAAN